MCPLNKQVEDNGRRESSAIVGRVLRSLRIQKSVTQQQLADSLGLPQSYVSKYEMGERRLDVVEVRIVCAVLDTTLHEFVDLLESDQ